jgi:hypothetical protein
LDRQWTAVPATDAVPHGFAARATNFPSPPRLALDHARPCLPRRAFAPPAEEPSPNRATYFEQCREMMQAWADYLDELRCSK